MKAVFINNFRRLLVQKQLVLLLLIFVTVAASAAIYVSTGMTESWNIALMSPNAAFQSAFKAESSDRIHWTDLDSEPSYSELVSGRYDALVRIEADGDYVVETIKSEESAGRITAAVEGTLADSGDPTGRGVGTNLFGYLMMFLLLMGSMAMCFYSDDREQKQILRISCSPAKMSGYLLAHSLFNTAFLFVPTLLIVLLLCGISGVSPGYSFWQLAGLLGLICTFSTVFCLFLYSFFSNKAESAKMAGNTVIILTSILAGSFYAFEEGNAILELLIRVLPQRAFLILASGLEQQSPAGEYLPALLYLVLLTAVLFFLSVVKVQKEYVNKC